jgi:hypothetical protein
MKGPEYIQVRLLKSTYDQLQAFSEEEQLKARKRPQAYSQALSKTRVSVCDVVDELLCRWYKEQARKRAWMVKRRAKQKPREDQLLLFDMERMVDEGCPNHT